MRRLGLGAIPIVGMLLFVAAHEPTPLERSTFPRGVEIVPFGVSAMDRDQAPAATARLAGGTCLFQTFVRSDVDAASGLATLAPEVRRELEQRLMRRQAVVSALPNPRRLAFPLNVVAEARRNHEAAIIALLGPSVAREAAEFASRVRLFYEWEGYAEPPLDEAASAAAYVTSTPGTSIGRYVSLFRLHRYRSAFEAATWETTQSPYGADVARNTVWADTQRRLQRDAATQYAVVLDQLRRDTDVVVRAIAEDLDARDFVYVDTQPRAKMADFVR